MKPLLLAFIFISVTLLQTSHGQPDQLNALLANSQNNLALEAIFGMGMRLGALHNRTTSKNFVVSPISATVVVAQLMLGAKGKFRKDLYQLLSIPNSPTLPVTNHRNNRTTKLPYAGFHFQLMSLIKTLQRGKDGDKFTLKQSSALFYNQNIELRKNFKIYLKGFYSTELEALDFYNDTKSIINQWASDHTQGLVKNVLSMNPPPDTSAIFMNSIYFLGEWETPFSFELNQEDLFYTTENTTVNATFMLGDLEHIKYIQADGYRMICLPYKNEELGMYILYPNLDNEHKYDMKKFVAGIDAKELFASVLTMKYHNVLVRIPKLSLSNTMSMLGSLRQYAALKKQEQENNTDTTVDPNLNGLDALKERIDKYTNFTGPIDSDILLTAAAQSENLRVSDIVQHMVFSINEKGTEAAAVTAGITDYMGGAKTVILNRPFVFYVMHEATQATLFWGAISDPSSQ